MPRPQNPVLLRAANTPEFVVELLAHLLAGFGVLPLSVHLPEGEVKRLVAQAQVERGCPHPQLPEGQEQPANPVSLAASDHQGHLRMGTSALQNQGWLCLPSSGTTGLPKLVRRDLPALEAVAAQTIAATGLAANDCMLLAIPASHSYGIDSMFAALLAGATLELENTFDPGKLHARLRESRASVLPAVPVMVEMLLRMDDGNPLPHLRLVYCAGAPLPETLWHEVAQKMGLKIGVLYGATEMGSVFFEHGDAPGFSPACVGLPMAGVRLRLGSDGEVFIQAPSMMHGYWHAEAGGLEADGFFATGDLGEITPAGRLRLTGRKKLLIDVGGSKVNPLEVEAILRQAPGVKQCVVVAEPVTETIRRVKALVVMHENGAFDSHALKAHCKAQLAAHKVPRIFEQRHALPTSATGKVLRGQL